MVETGDWPAPALVKVGPGRLETGNSQDAFQLPASSFQLLASSF